MFRRPLHTLPDGYQQVAHLVLTDPKTLGKLVVYALIGLAVSVVGMILWAGVVYQIRGPQLESGFTFLPGLALAILVTVLVLILHEAVHGAVILLTGHKPRFGMILEYGVLYATADNAYFRRGEFIAIALAPLIVLTALGLLLTLILPAAYYFSLALGVIINGSGAVGDLWMTALVLRYPANVLVQDEADSIRIFIKS